MPLLLLMAGSGKTGDLRGSCRTTLLIPETAIEFEPGLMRGKRTYHE